MTDRKPTPLLIRFENHLDLQVGKGLVGAIVELGVQEIRDLRSGLVRDGKHLPSVRVRAKAIGGPVQFPITPRRTADNRPGAPG